MKSSVKILIGAAVAGIIGAGTGLSAVHAEEQAMTKDAVKCVGVNECKGKGACHSSTNQCKGQNECKGKGFMMMSKADCEAKGGKVESTDSTY
jgi:hypothetical protein